MSEVLPKVTVQIPISGDPKRRSKFYVADADSKDAAELHAALDYILACPEECERSWGKK